jgi:hypothetical protein
VVTGSVVLDLATAKRDKMRHRLSSLVEIPDGARVVVSVGATAPEPEAVRLLAEHSDRLVVDVQGTAYAVRRWIAVLRAGTLDGVLL